MLRVALPVVASLCGTAMAQDLLQIDTNAMTTRASGPFSEEFTGSFSVLNTALEPDIDGDAMLLDLLIDGVRQNTGGADGDHFSFMLEIEFVDGDITSGSAMIAHDMSGSENVYTAELVASSGGAILEVGVGTFIIGGMTFNGLWEDALGTFLDVDISPWGLFQPVEGRFADIAFTPDENHLDPDTDVDLFMVVPAPAGVMVFAAAGLLCRRRR